MLIEKALHPYDDPEPAWRAGPSLYGGVKT